jgi:hypothetical protein
MNCASYASKLLEVQRVSLKHISVPVTFNIPEEWILLTASLTVKQAEASLLLELVMRALPSRLIDPNNVIVSVLPLYKTYGSFPPALR